MFESEERQIVERIKEYIKSEKFIHIEFKIMLRNGHILNIGDYRDMVKRGKINPQDAYVYIRTSTAKYYKKTFYYLFLEEFWILLEAYLSKLGFYYDNFVVPATGLKYVVGAVNYYKYIDWLYLYEEYLSIDVVNLDTAVNNTNLRKIMSDILGEKLISGEKKLTNKEYKKILKTFGSQRLLAGHNFEEAGTIIDDYYDKGKRSLVKEVARIVMSYDKIFEPYRTCYDMKKWKEIDCWSIKLD